MADLAEIEPNFVVLESSRSIPQFCEFALLLAEDAQVFAGAIELRETTLTPAEAVRLFGRKLRETARRLAPEQAPADFQSSLLNSGRGPKGELELSFRRNRICLTLATTS